jgi:hypothetical protein
MKSQELIDKDVFVEGMRLAKSGPTMTLKNGKSPPKLN